MSVIDEVRAYNDEFERLASAYPRVETVGAPAVRAEQREGRLFPPPVMLPQARWVSVPARGGDVRVRVLAPEGEATGVYLHFHGGGWTLGAADIQDVALWELVEATGLVAASVDYRLAPEHPYPAAPDDAEDVALWLVTGGAEELGAPKRLAIGGESAGAHLSATTLLRLRDRHRRRDFAAANLVYGVFDLSSTPSRRLDLRTDPGLPASSMDWFVDCFLPGRTPEERRAPDVSPLYADLRDLPPALFTVGTRDPLLDDTLFMEARWRSAGNETTLTVVEEALHGFTGFPIAAARRFHDERNAFLRDALAAADRDR